MQQGKQFSFPTLTDLKQGDKEIRRILQQDNKWCDAQNGMYIV